MRNLIVCETRGGFHASFGRGNPCTLVKERCGTPSLLEGVRGEAAAIYLARYFTGEEAGGRSRR